MREPDGLSRRGFLHAGAAGLALGGLTSLAEPAGAASAANSHDHVQRLAATQAQASGTTREYWIQVDSFEHNLVPTGEDQMMGAKFTASETNFPALGYRAFTPNWGAPLPADDLLGPNAGIPGPTIRAQVGDTVLVHFKNNDTNHHWPHSMHPHGFEYDTASDGGYIAAQPDVPGRAVPFGGTYTYTWTAQPNSVGTWPYHDHSLAQTLTKKSKSNGMNMGSGIMELNAELGMFGVIAITDAATPAVDRELVLVLHDLYQADVPSLSQDFDCFNGAAYLGNTPTFTAKVGDRVRWRVVALGKEFHVFHLHGHRWQNDAGRFVDSQILGPSTTLTIEYTEDNPGDWLYHCHVTDHMAGGMVGRYRVPNP